MRAIWTSAFCLSLLIIGSSSSISSYTFHLSSSPVQKSLKIYADPELFPIFQDSFKSLNETSGPIQSSQCSLQPSNSMQDFPVLLIKLSQKSIPPTYYKCENSENDQFMSTSSIETLLDQIKFFISHESMKSFISFSVIIENYQNIRKLQSCSPKTNGCKTCLNSTYCGEAMEGFYLDKNNKINRCGLGCDKCENYENCTRCYDGYFLEKGICRLCHLNCLKCDGDKCKLCDFGFYLDEDVCKPCMDGCYLCANSSHCGQTFDGFSISEGGFTEKCREGCMSCKAGTCLECLAGYFLQNSYCLPCSEGCYECVELNYCVECSSGYYLNSASVCERCVPNCLECSSSVCSTCDHKYYVTSKGKCLKCLPNCESCENTQTCDTCSSGYYSNKTSCSPCPDGCIKCDRTKCSTCLDIGYYNSSGTCKPCSSGCSICPSGICQSCLQGYYYDSENKVCKECTKGCQSCLDSYNCTSCISNYYIEDSQCVEFPHGCLTWSKYKCFKCKTGFYLNENSCFKCQSNCFACSDESTCSICNTGYYLQGDNCVKCEEYNVNCNSTSILSCEDGYYLSGGSCISCSGNCSVCAGTDCGACKVGFKLNGDCKLCSDNCDACPDHYYLSSGVCKPCIDYCLSCSSGTNCNKCEQGYFYEDSCVPCPDDCETCFNSTICLTCAAGFYVNSLGLCKNCDDSKCSCSNPYYFNSSKVCNSCELTCSECSSNSLCQKCITGYSLDSSLSCYKCPSFCESCSDSGCLQCKKGFALKNKICLPCSANCLDCYTLTICKECQAGFYLTASFDCRPCSSNCYTCTESSCTLCNPGYIFDSSGSCINPIENCLIYSDSETCSYCSNEYTAKNGDCYICQNLELEKASFSTGFQFINFEFNKQINTSIADQINNCSVCEDIARPDGYYGQNCWCQVYKNVFSIRLGQDFLLSSSSKILIIVEKLFKYVCIDEQRLMTVFPSYTEIPNIPVPEIQYQPYVSFNCDSKQVNFEVSTVYYSYGFEINYIWILTTSPSNPIAESLALIEKGYSLSIDLDVFNGVETLMNITVKVRNMVSLTGSASSMTQLIKKKYIGASVEGGSSRVLLYNSQYTISGKVNDNCGDLMPDYKWSIDGQNMENFDSNLEHILYIPAFSLPPNILYNVKLRVSNSESTYGYVNFTITTKYSPLVIILSSQYSDIPASQDFILNASSSYNPNIPDPIKQTQGLNFKWLYCIHLENEDCTYLKYSDSTKLTNFSMNSTFLRSNLGKYLRVQLNLSSDNYGFVYKTSEFFISPNDLIVLSLYSAKEKYEMVNFGELFTSSVSVKNEAIGNNSLIWSIEGGKISSKFKWVGNRTPNLYIYRKSLYEFDKSYKLTIQSYYLNKPYTSAYILINKNIPPFCSSNLQVVPEISDKDRIYTDMFVFKIHNCIDSDNDYPLTYRFSLRRCELNCDNSSILNGSSINSAYYQLSIQKSFNSISAKMFFTSFNASVQICDSMRTCNDSVVPLCVAKSSETPTDLIQQYIEDTKLWDMIPYYSIMYIKLFRDQLSSDEYNYIYRSYSWYIRKIKIVNFDLVHICLSFINEQFKVTSGNNLKLRYIRQYLVEAYRIIKRTTDILTQQNSDVFTEIINNIIQQISDNKSSFILLSLVLDYARLFYKLFSYDRVVGDMIVSSSLTNSNSYLYKDTVQNILNSIPSPMNKLVPNITSISSNKFDIVTVYALKLLLKSTPLYIVSLGKSGYYHTTNQSYYSTFDSEIGIKKKSIHFFITDSNSNDKCYSFNDITWKKEDYCEISSNKSIIQVSSNKINRVEDKNYFNTVLTNNIAPLCISIFLLTSTFIVYAIIRWRERGSEPEGERRHRKRKVMPLAYSTKEAVLKNMLFLSFFSRDPNINKFHKLLQLSLILNVQLLLDGLFFGLNVISGQVITIIVGTGYCAPLITSPLNIIASYNILDERKNLGITFILTWILFHILTTVGVVYINIFIAIGESAYWILSFGIGLTCELVIELGVMFWKNMRDKEEINLSDRSI